MLQRRCEWAEDPFPGAGVGVPMMVMPFIFSPVLAEKYQGTHLLQLEKGTSTVLENAISD